MSRRTMYRVHKWVALTVAGFLLAWLISGFVMAFPTVWLKKLVQRGAVQAKSPSVEATPMADFRDIRISVPEAIAVLEADLGRESHVTGVKVTRFGNGLAYEIARRGGSRHLVDALRGTRIVITQAMAEKMARAAAPNAGGIARTDLLSKRDFYYGGPLPVYKIAFDDGWGTVVYVSAATGKVQNWNRLVRFRRWVVSLHGFEPLRLISDNNKIRVGLLLLFALVGIGTVGTGLYLALPVRTRRTQVAQRENVARYGEKEQEIHGSTNR